MKKHVVLSDCLVAAIVLLCSLLLLCGNGADNGRTLFSIWCMAAVYCACRLSFVCVGKYMQYILPVLIAVACLYESVLGILQLTGLSDSNNCFFGCTGSFKNPGPYGGFLAVCIAVTGFYALRDCSKRIRIITGLSALSGLIILPSTMSRAAILALAAAVLYLALTSENGKIFLKKHIVWLAPAVIVLCCCAYVIKRPSADGRMFINRMSGRMICRHALTGVGQGCYAGAYGEEQYNYFNTQISRKGTDSTDWTVLDQNQRMVADSPEYAFNEFLQFGAENGVAAMTLLIALFVIGIVQSHKQRTAWCGGLVSFAVFAMFSYPMHVVSFQILLPVMLAAGVSEKSAETGHILMVKYANILMLIILTVLIACKIPFVYKQKSARSTWEKTEYWYNSGFYDYVIADADSLYDYMKHDSNFLFEYGQALSKTGQYEKSDSVLMQGLKISCDPMFWNVMGNNSFERGDFDKAVERYTHAFCMVPNRLYPLCRIARTYFARQETDDFDYMLQKINSFPAKVESATTEKLRKEINELPVTGNLDDTVNKTHKFR